MIRVIGIDGSVNEVKKSLKEERKNINRVRNLLFGKLMEGERDKVMMILMGMFGRLRYEELEEVYSDGCLVMWGKLNEKGFRLEGESLVRYLVKVCKNVGMHYLRKVRDDVMSLDDMMYGYGEKNDGEGLMEMFDVMDDKSMGEKDVYKKLDRVWGRLSDVDRMILESYYWEGCKMDEIAQRVGYKNADTVKSKKSKVLKRMMKMMNEEAGLCAGSSSFSPVAA